MTSVLLGLSARELGDGLLRVLFGFFRDVYRERSVTNMVCGDELKSSKLIRITVDRLGCSKVSDDEKLTRVVQRCLVASNDISSVRHLDIEMGVRSI